MPSSDHVPWRVRSPPCAKKPQAGRKKSQVPKILFSVQKNNSPIPSTTTMGKSTDASRAERKAKKRALEAAIPDLPGDHENAEDVEVEAEAEKKSKKRKRDVVVEEDSESKKARKEKKDKKKRKSEATEVEEELQEEKPAKKSKKEKKEGKAPDANGDSVPAVASLDGEEEPPRKSKKERKAERKAAEAAAENKTIPTKAVPEANGDTIAEEKKSKKNNRNREKKRKGESANGDTEGKAARFIVFIGTSYHSLFIPSNSTSTNFHIQQGNLPFTATTASIQKHFASVKPISVRHLTHKDDPKKSKGAAFVEFDGYDHMKTCLKLFHHSMFDDGISPARKINVELTYVPLPLSSHQELYRHVIAILQSRRRRQYQRPQSQNPSQEHEIERGAREEDP
jgi:nucleolar protein 6